MPKKSTKNTDIVAWQDNAANGFTRGIITQHVPRPYFIEISPNGKWLLLTINDDDKPVHVATGKAKDVLQAKVEARGNAIANVPTLKAALQVADATERGDEPPVLVSARRATLRFRGALTALILWAGFFFYWFWVIRPKIAVLTLLILAAGVYAAHCIEVYLEQANGRRERLAKKQQAVQMVKMQQQSGQPAMRR